MHVVARALWALLALGALLPASAQAQPATGDNAWALPGLVRIGLPTAPEHMLGVAASAGYAATEPQGDVAGWHHRAQGSLAIGLTPAPWLSAALRFDGRYDAHPDDGMGSDSGALGDPRLLVRAGHNFSPGASLGLELVLWMPGQEAPSIEPSASTLDGKLLLAFAPSRSLTVASHLGFRFDQSAASAENADALRPGDRLALGVSDYHAALLALGLGYHATPSMELLFELSADLLVGSDAPRASRSPMRATGGVRYHMSRSLQLQLLVESSLSKRPPQEPGDGLVPIEPRLGALAGLQLLFGGGGPPLDDEVLPDEPSSEPNDQATEPVAKQDTAVETPEPPPAEAEPAAPAVAPGVTISGLVSNENGGPLPGVRVVLSHDEGMLEATSDASGRFELHEVPPGPATLTLNADGMKELTRALDVGPAGQSIELAMEPSIPRGQIRGNLRSFAGKPLNGSAVVYPGQYKARADEKGYFEMDVPPGRYKVRLRAHRFKSQNREVVVKENGVTVLNVELRRK